MTAASSKAGSGFSIVELALTRPYTFIVMAMLIVLATPFTLRSMPTDFFPEINIPVVGVIWRAAYVTDSRMFHAAVFLVKALGGDYATAVKVASE